MKILIYNARLVDANNDSKGSVLIEDGLISSVIYGENENLIPETFSKYTDGDDLIKFDAKGLTLMPSFVDMHVHFRYPGQSEKETLQTGLKAACKGGFGTVVLMPNTNPVVSSAEMAMEIKASADSFGLADVFQTVSITKDFGGTDTSHLDFLDKDRIPVITEDGRDVASSAVMLEAMEKCARNGIIVSCHSEDPTLAKEAKKYREEALNIIKHESQTFGIDSIENIHQKNYAMYSKICDLLNNAERILAIAEDTATDRNLALALSAGCPVHIAHVSTKKSLDAIRRAKQFFPKSNSLRTAPVTCEVTPHHISLTNALPELVNPPLRSEENRKAVIDAIADGTVDVISTDHAPHTMQDKQNGCPGFTGLETAFSVCYSVLVKTETITLQKLSQLMSANPSERLGIKCGLLKSGYKANLVLVDTEKEWKVDSSKFYSKGKYTPINGTVLSGTIETVFYNGKQIILSNDR